MKHLEALQKIAKLNSNYKLVDAVSIATEALEQSEPTEELQPKETIEALSEKVLEKYFPNPDDLVNGRVKNVIIKAMEEHASLAKKQVIDEIEKWVNEKDFEQPFNNSASISVFDLVTFLNNLKK